LVKTKFLHSGNFFLLHLLHAFIEITENIPLGCYPFGAEMDGRSHNPDGYRYGFNGMEKDNEVEGEGDSYTTEFRQYDPRLGRWWSVDPLVQDYPWSSPYVGLDNNPLRVIDPTGEGTEDPQQKYQVQSGNTLGGIAKDHNTTVNDIVKMNPSIKDPNKIFPGQEINLPGSPNSSSSNAPQSSTVSNNGGTESTKTNATPQAAYTAPTSTTPVNPQTQTAGFEGGEHFIGPAMYLLGQPLEYLKPVGALSSKAGSSIASSFLSKAIPYKSPVIKQITKVTAKMVGEKASTAVAGRALGRLVPFLGELLIVYDVGSVWFPAAKGGIEQYNKDHPIDKPGNLIYHICFEKGTLVYSKSGLVPIEVIQKGDSVFTYNLEADRVELGKVLNTLERNTGEIYELTTTDQKINVTSEHPFYVEGKGWITVKELKIGDKFKTVNRSSAEQVKRISSVKKDLIVYNIEVEGNHNYFVTSSNILVHNKYIRPFTKEETLKLEISKEKLKKEN
jgi:RHS repeat-associated protein